MTTNHRSGYKHGAAREEGGYRFRVWAPRAKEVRLKLTAPGEAVLEMEAQAGGYYERLVEGVEAGARYLYRLDGEKERPDPASRYQPEGVHAASELVDERFAWTDEGWPGLKLEDCVFYELHTGTFSAAGTFDGVSERLHHLVELGITMIELMPVGQFPGERNWGYDGCYPYAVQASYGGPEGLKRLVNACHAVGVGVALDVVYNHLGPEGNYLGEFGPYFTERYRTPWGQAVNFDGAESDEVRRFFVESAERWVREFHIDALRLDAVHAIHDESAYPFLEELGDAVHLLGEQLGRRVHVVAESDRNDPRVVERQALGGIGLDAVWNDDFHHALRTVVTGERDGYFVDFGAVGQLGKAYAEGFVRDGSYSAFHERRHGRSSRGVEAERFVVFSQNHDQTGNRMLGERLAALVDFERLKTAAAACVLSPFLPLLFMGEEYAETAPFLYFTSHGDAGLVEAVRAGRKSEFAAFAWQGEPPDPQAEETFQASKLKWYLKEHGRHAAMLDLYRTMLRLRKATAALATLRKEQTEVWWGEEERVVAVRRWVGRDEALLVLSFGGQTATEAPLKEGRWVRVLDTGERKWMGPGAVFPAEVSGGAALVLPAGTVGAALYRRKREARRRQSAEASVVVEGAA